LAMCVCEGFDCGFSLLDVLQSLVRIGWLLVLAYRVLHDSYLSKPGKLLWQSSAAPRLGCGLTWCYVSFLLSILGHERILCALVGCILVWVICRDIECIHRISNLIDGIHGGFFFPYNAVIIIFCI